MASGPERPNVSILTGLPVLIVEDAWHVAKALKSTLEQMGIHVIGPTATTAEARSLTSAQSPQLAIVDINLKQETSCGLINELCQQGVQVIVISGYAADSAPLADTQSNQFPDNRSDDRGQLAISEPA